eukprot:356382-Chlamydomonas_euryale.AAC.6
MRAHSCALQHITAASQLPQHNPIRQQAGPLVTTAPKPRIVGRRGEAPSTGSHGKTANTAAEAAAAKRSSLALHRTRVALNSERYTPSSFTVQRSPGDR